MTFHVNFGPDCAKLPRSAIFVVFLRPFMEFLWIIFFLEPLERLDEIVRRKLQAIHSVHSSSQI